MFQGISGFLTGLKQATVTNIMKDFLNWGIVTEVGFLNGSKGRRSIGVSLTRTVTVSSVRLARKHSVGLFDLTGTQITKRVDFKPEEQPDAEDILNQIAAEMRILMKNTEKIPYWRQAWRCQARL